MVKKPNRQCNDKTLETSKSNKFVTVIIVNKNQAISQKEELLVCIRQVAT